MKSFQEYPSLKGKHALLGGSNYHWINYTDDKFKELYSKSMAAQRGTELHEFAAFCIKLGQKLPKSGRTLNRYVNDAIGYRMQPEVVLYYSENCFGTADSIAFDKNTLRIHDFKSGVIPAHMEQLYIYDALFCLNYNVKPQDIFIENRIYQNDDVLVANPEPTLINDIMNTIIHADRIIEAQKAKVR